VAEVMRRAFIAVLPLALALAGRVAAAADAEPQWQRIQLRSNLKYHSLIGGLTISPDDRFVWAITGNPPEGNETRVISVRLRREVARIKLPDDPNWDGECAWGRTGVAMSGSWRYDEGASVLLFDAQRLSNWLAGGRLPQPRHLRFPRQGPPDYPPARARGLVLSPGEIWLSLVADACDLPATERPCGGVLLVERATGTPVPVAIPGTTCCPAASFVSDDELDVVCLTPTSARPRWYVVRRQGRAWAVVTSRNASDGVAPSLNGYPANATRDTLGRLWLSWPAWQGEDVVGKSPTGVLRVVDPQGATISAPIRQPIDRIVLGEPSHPWLVLRDGSALDLSIVSGTSPRLSVRSQLVPPLPAVKDSYITRAAISRSGRVLVTGQAGDPGKGATLWLWERERPTLRRKR
jgi:hypothetical protein